MEKELKKMLLSKVDKWPLCSHYSELIEIACEKFNIGKKEARRQYGLLTYKEWSEILTIKF